MPAATGALPVRNGRRGRRRVAIDEQRGTLGTVRNAALLLELLSEGPAYHQLTELADQAGMSLPTVHRLLRSLVAAGLVEQDSRTARYGLGPQLVYLSERYLGRLPVLNAAAPYLGDLRDALGATVMIAVLVRGHVVYVDRVDAGDAGGVFRESSRLRHAFATPAGQLLIAHASTEEWRQAEAALAQAAGAPRATPADRRRWSRAPYLLVHDDEGGRAAFELAVPIRSGDAVPAALVATGSTDHENPDELTDKLAPRLERAALAVGRTIAHA
jgi:IclR family acetate operon transcriptional repressor